jgi:hypothetical protein
MPCECIAKVNEAMAPMNGEIGTRFAYGPEGFTETVLLTVSKVAPRGKKPPGLLAKFCPICGTAYTPPETVPLASPNAPSP